MFLKLISGVQQPILRLKKGKYQAPFSQSKSTCKSISSLEVM